MTSSPDPKTWAIDAPRAGTRDPLVVRFPESLDRALLDRLIWVENAEANVVAGQISAGRGRDNLAIHAGEPLASGRLSPGRRHRAGRPGGEQCRATV